MKKLLAIILLLLMIFVGMYVYRYNSSKNTVNVSDVNQIQDYLSKIYMWKEVTGEALPKFDNINDAPDLWVWEVVKRNLEDTTFTYDQIQNEANALYGKNFKKEFPKEGTDYLKYDDQTGKYVSTNIELDAKQDTFLINTIKKNGKKFEVEIVEYVEDNEEGNVKFDPNSFDSEIEYNVYIKNLNDEIIGSRKSNEDKEMSIDIVKQNMDKFSKKTLTLVKDNEKLYIQKVQ